MGEQSEAVPVISLIDGDKDNFNGVIIKPRHYGDATPEQFQQRMAASLEAWSNEGKRGVWVKISITRAELVPLAAKLGFEFHHAQSDYVMMTKWLPTHEESTIPLYATHNIVAEAKSVNAQGVGENVRGVAEMTKVWVKSFDGLTEADTHLEGVAGCVVNDKNEVLVVQERWLRSLKIKHWKLPGGVAEPGEDLWETAMRETLEETGIKTEFVAVLTFRHMHNYRWGTSDLYFSCLLRPLNSDITVNTTEIADATWMDVDTYLADPETYPTNQMMLQAYKDGVERGLFVKPTVFPHFLPNRQDLAMYKVESCDPNTESCDSKTKSCDKSRTVTMDSTTPKSNI